LNYLSFLAHLAHDLSFQVKWGLGESQDLDRACLGKIRQGRAPMLRLEGEGHIRNQILEELLPSLVAEHGQPLIAGQPEHHPDTILGVLLRERASDDVRRLLHSRGRLACGRAVADRRHLGPGQRQLAR